MNSKEQIIKDYEKIINFVIKRMGLSKRREELFDLGMIGFVRGINSYDESKGYTIMTYLYDCIKNEFLKYFDYENRKGRKTEIISLNKLIGENKDTELIDLIGYELNTDNDIYFQELIKKILVYMREHFTYRQEEIFKYVYGIDGFPMLNFEQIAKIYGTTKQNIYGSHKIIMKKLEKLFKEENLYDKDN